MPLLALLLLAPAQVVLDPSGIAMPMFDAERRFHENVARSRWSANTMEYVDGVSSSVLRHPYTIAHAAASELFVASFTLNHVVRLRWIDGKRAQYKVFVKGRDLDGPVGMALDHAGSLFIASFTNDVVLRVNASDGALLDRIGDEESLDCPEGLALSPDGRLFVASFLLPHLSVFDPQSGAFLGRFGALAPQPAQPAPRPAPSLAGAEDVAFDSEGAVHVSAYYSSAVYKFDAQSGALLAVYGQGLVSGPVGIACDPSSGDMFVSSYRDDKVLRFTPGGAFVGVAAGADVSPDGEAGAAQAELRARRQRRGATIRSPSGLSFDPHDGTLWVASYATGAVTRFNSSAWGGGRTWRVTD
uniref:SMP-30/Gluconolactonase/LRE-like region domain-containing protein n=1 Tax=Emiliania huxleyi TaxID=2903 RepID=A0A7S3RT63_EMIHU